MKYKELKIKYQTFEKAWDAECFEVTGSPDNAYHGTRNNCDYESVLELISKTCPDTIIIDPEEIKSMTLVRLLHDLHENYYPQCKTSAERWGICRKVYLL